MNETGVIGLDPPRVLKCDFGPVSFGLIISGAVVSWSGREARDLLIGRCWDGIFLYPSDNLEDADLAKEPVKLVDTRSWTPLCTVTERDKDGRGHLIIANRDGFLRRFERRGDHPEWSFEYAGMLEDKSHGLLFNIPYENPNHPVINDLDGYIDTLFYSYPQLCSYPLDDRNTNNLIIGDLSGNLWWMPDLACGEGASRYEGVRYVKSQDGMAGKRSSDYVAQYGSEYVKPPAKICDDRGVPFLLGRGTDTGNVYEGGSTKPALYRNRQTGACDLLVMADTWSPKLYYLKRINPEERVQPVFQNMGEIDLSDCSAHTHCHSTVIVIENSDGWHDLLIPMSENNAFVLAVFRNRRENSDVPTFQFSHMVSGKHVAASGNNFTGMLVDRRTGETYLLDNHQNNSFSGRKLTLEQGQPIISREQKTIQDQHGVFRLEGETDPTAREAYGFNRASRWDFDRSGRQHFIVGTDKGLLYLLIEESDLGENFTFKSIGPLKDRTGQVIRVHNRSCACGVDLDGDGLEDLVVGGISYQLGIQSDPSPGGGFYYLLNRGLDENGVPILDALRELPIEGHEFHCKINSHVHLQSVDIDRDGEKEIILSNQNDQFKGRIFKVLPDRPGVRYTGTYVERLSIEENLLDIDGDGLPEHVFGGGEEGIVQYRKLRAGKPEHYESADLVV